MFAIAWYDDVEAAELFRHYGAGIEDAHFLAAFFWKRLNIAVWFLDNGADVNHIGPEGFSALHLAVKRKADRSVIQFLLDRGADVNRENKEGMSPRKLALQNSQRSVLKLFEEKSK